jgi:hypothetical protein
VPRSPRPKLRGRGRRCESAVDRSTRPLDGLPGPTDHELGVGEKQSGFDLEGELGRVFGGIDRPLGLSFAHSSLESLEPVARDADKTISNGARLHVDLS